MQFVEIKNLSVGYGHKPVLSHFDLTVSAGEFVSIIGPNGAGKTTLFKTLMGLMPPKAGSVKILDRLRIGYVPQQLSLDNNIPISVSEFLNLKRHIHLASAEIEDLKKTMGISHILGRALGALSVGEQQRVFLTFALMGSPQLILLDESLEGIDLGAQSKIYQLLNSLTKSGCSIILISHDISAVSQWSKRVICVGGKKLFDGDPNSPEFHKCLHKVYGEKSLIHDHHH
jgi:zinc transport system ATP-binding protein